MKKKLFAVCSLFSSCASMIGDNSDYSKLGDNNFYLTFWIIIGLSIMFEISNRICEYNLSSHNTDEFIVMLITIISAIKLTSLISDSLGNLFWVILMFIIFALLIGIIFGLLLSKTRLKAKHIKYLLYSIAAIDCCVWLFHCKI